MSNVIVKKVQVSYSEVLWVEDKYPVWTEQIPSQRVGHNKKVQCNYIATLQSNNEKTIIRDVIRSSTYRRRNLLFFSINISRRQCKLINKFLQYPELHDINAQTRQECHFLTS